MIYLHTHTRPCHQHTLLNSEFDNHYPELFNKEQDSGIFQVMTLDKQEETPSMTQFELPSTQIYSVFIMWHVQIVIDSGFCLSLFVFNQKLIVGVCKPSLTGSMMPLPATYFIYAWELGHFSIDDVKKNQNGIGVFCYKINLKCQINTSQSWQILH